MDRTALRSRIPLARLLTTLLLVRECAASSNHYASQLRACFNVRYKTASSWNDYMNTRVGSMWMHEVFWSSKNSSLPLTVFTITTVDRLGSVEKQCMHYAGPHVTAAFVPLIMDADDTDAGAALATDSRQGAAARRLAATGPRAATWPPRPPKLTMSQQGRLRHAVQRLRDMFDRLERQPSACAMRILVFYELVTAPALTFLIPVNALRNAALLAVTTPMATMVDADLTISDTLTQLLQDKQRLQDLSAGCEARTAYVMPAFDPLRNATLEERQNISEWAMSIPAFQKAKLQTSSIQIFNWPYKDGHGPTNYTMWFNSTADYQVSYRLRYEPWVIVSRTQMPPYDARYRGYFWNKVAHVLHVAALGFTFRVLPDVWLMHWPHQPQAAWAAHPLSRTKNLESGVQKAMQQVHEDRGRNKTTSVLHHDLMLSLLQQQLYELADHGVTGKQPFAPVVGPQAAWCFRVLPWWRQEKGRTVVAMEEVQNDGQEAGGDGGRAGRT